MIDKQLTRISRVPQRGYCDCPPLSGIHRLLTTLGGELDCYRDKVMGYNPIAYWMLAEAAGAIAEDEVNSPAQDGTAVGVTWGQPGIGEPCGTTVPLFDGANDYIDVFSAAFQAAFNGSEGTFFTWARVFNAAVWNDASFRRVMNFLADANNNLLIATSNVMNRLIITYEAGGVVNTRNVATGGPLTWFTAGLTWSALANEVRMFFNGVQDGPILVPGVWMGNLSVNSTLIGAASQVPTNVWHGYIGHSAVWDSALTPAQIADLSVF